MMGFSFLITRPNHDVTTHYLFSWAQPIVDLAEKRDAKILDLSGEKANKTEFESKINKFSPELIMLNGHGNEDFVTGNKNEILVKVGVNEFLFKDRIVYALSCRSAKILGPKSIKAGARNYTGYEDDFIFMYEPNLFTRPLQDQTAALFLEPSNIFVESIIKGNNIENSYKRAREQMKKNLNKAMSTLGSFYSKIFVVEFKKF